MTSAKGKHVIILVAVIVTALFTGCGCSAIKIESGGEEAVALSETKARELRTRWAQQVQKATPQETVILLKQYIDTAASRLIKMGEQFAAEWQRGNEGRGEDIPDTRMREVIQATIRRDKPIFQAWEDNIDYAWQKVQQSNEISDNIMGKIYQMINQYDRVYSVVMFPNGTMRIYEDAIVSAAGEMQSISKFLDIDIISLR